jgi:hypothetical protein
MEKEVGQVSVWASEEESKEEVPAMVDVAPEE